MPVKAIAMPICELCDRLTIAQLKYERLPDDELDKQGLRKQIAYYWSGVDPRNIPLQNLIVDLREINGQIWDAEWAIRKGLDDRLGLEEVGRRAIVVRDLNRQRVALKNQITSLVNQDEFADCKMNHVSG